MYYILKNDGTTLFEQPYCLEFCLHCLFHLIDSEDLLLQNCRLLQLNFNSVCNKKFAEGGFHRNGSEPLKSKKAVNSAWG